MIRALAADAGADIGRIDVDVSLAAYVAHQGRTGAEHVAALAALGGAFAAFDADGALTVASPPSAADLALRHGRELVACEVDGWPGARRRARPGRVRAGRIAAGAGRPAAHARRAAGRRSRRRA